jgi:CO/xanthine dehydrogenase FAD-binding subunit
MSPPEDVRSEDRNLYYRPKTLEQAVAHLAMPGVQVLSGGTDFYPALGDRIVRSPVMDISGLRELRGISVESEFLRIGGLTTWTDILRASLPPG